MTCILKMGKKITYRQFGYINEGTYLFKSQRKILTRVDDEYIYY